ncbi:protein-L-isoaspartate O-methyltransferase [Paracoccus sp. (in: a-proteobacteria)]|uniref:protein-L-isoaspartate O-methyltransferase family protein n=1 Tax=Paracoccus sp. TaxID=267 RepID=UPI0026DF8066|nr:protein-L-isoaspartate O-methyltransferase [Paracoccus sp. (in: a-proteobacteria)]MDO5648186.1 protein-L-isoaspartate O-methyltransferase [Paracoccus sp. (in: a-proteobacteria)]
MQDFAASRTMMVDTQVRPNDVTKFPVIEAMLSVPREHFVPDAQRHVAYSEDDLAVGHGRIMLAPRSFSKMIDGLDIQPTDLVLHIGAGLGYSAAVLARMAQAVVAIDDQPELVAEAQRRLAQVGADNAVVTQAELAAGAPGQAPFDAILIEGAVQDVPAAVLDQLADGGRIAALFMDGALGTVRIGHKVAGQVSWRFAFNATAALVPGFERRKEFVL